MSAQLQPQHLGGPDGKRRALALLAAGRLEEGWKALAAAPDLAVHVAAAPWWVGAPARGRVVVMGEPNLADEILLASVLPSAAVPDAAFLLAFDARWGALARRSFPDAAITSHILREEAGGVRRLAPRLDSPHVHGGELVSAWTTLRALLPAHRPRLVDFDESAPYLRPDPARVDHWRAWLAGLGDGPKLGVQWRPEPGAPGGEVPSLPLLGHTLAATGAMLVSLQGPEATAEAEGAGIRMHAPSGFDYLGLDDFAAISAALDTVVGPPAVATYVAGGVGARTLLLASPQAWPTLGSGGFPWFTQARVIAGPTTIQDLIEAVGRLPRSEAA
jgi:hypothetical protein